MTKLFKGVRDFLSSRARSSLTPLSNIAGKVYFDDLAAIMAPVIEQTRHLNVVEAVQPLHAEEIKKDYLSAQTVHNYRLGWTEHPGFTYAPNRAKLDLDSVKSAIVHAVVQVKKMEDSDSIVGDPAKALGCQLALQKLADDLDSINLIQAVTSGDDAAAKAAVRRKYGQLSEELIEAVEHLDDFQPEPLCGTAAFSADDRKLMEQRLGTATVIADAFKWGLSQYDALALHDGDFGYRVVITPEATAIDVRDVNSSGQPTILVPEKYNQEPKSLRQVLSLLEHEVKGHVRQSLTLAKIFGFGGLELKFSREDAYEGLAKWYDYHFEQSLGEPGTLPHPWYVLGIRQAQEYAGFDEIFHYLLNRMLEDSEDQDPATHASKAYDVTQRVLRGCSRIQTNPYGYAFTKDKAYLEGFLEVLQLCQLGLGRYALLANVSPRGLQDLCGIEIDKEFAWPYPSELGFAQRYWEDELQLEARRQSSLDWLRRYRSLNWD